MTTKQMDEVGSGMYGERRISSTPVTKASDLVEVIRKSRTGDDQRTGETFYRYEKIGVYSSELVALRAIVAKFCPDLTIQPLQIDG